MYNQEKRVSALEAQAGIGDTPAHVILWNAVSGWDRALAAHDKPILPGERVFSIEMVGVMPGFPEETAAVLTERQRHDDWMAAHQPT